MRKNWKTLLQNIFLFPFAFLLLVAAVEFLIIFGGTIFGSLTIDDWPKLMISPIFHGLSVLIVLLMFVPWEKVKSRFQNGQSSKI